MRHVGDDGLEQGVERAFADVIGQPGIAVAAARVEHREIELFVIGLEQNKQVEHFVEHLGGAGVGAVDLVDHDDRLEAQSERFTGDEFGLRHRAFGGIHQQDHPVDHRQDALDLAAEIGVARRIDDVDVGHDAIGIGPFHRGAFGQDGDPTLFLQVIGIHRSFFNALVVAEGARLAEKLIDERGLAMIDVGDNRHVAKVHLFIPEWSCRAPTAMSPLLQRSRGKRLMRFCF